MLWYIVDIAVPDLMLSAKVCRCRCPGCDGFLSHPGHGDSGEKIGGHFAKQANLSQKMAKVISIWTGEQQGDSVLI